MGGASGGATFNNSGTLASSDNVTNSGTFIQTGPQSWSPGTTFTNTAGTATFGTDPGTSATRTLTLTITGGTVTANTALHLASLTTSGTGALDLTTHDLFLSSGSIASLFIGRSFWPRP